MLKRLALVVAVVVLVAAAKVAWTKMEERGWVRTPTVAAAMRAMMITGALLLNPEALWQSRTGIQAQRVADDESKDSENSGGDAPPTRGRTSLAGRLLRWFLPR